MKTLRAAAFRLAGRLATALRLAWLSALICGMLMPSSAYDGVSQGIGWCAACGRDVSLPHNCPYASGGTGGGGYSQGGGGNIFQGVGAALGKLLRGGRNKYEAVPRGNTLEETQFRSATTKFSEQARRIPKTSQPSSSSRTLGIETTPSNPQLRQRERISGGVTKRPTPPPSTEANAALAHGREAVGAGSAEAAKEKSGLVFDTAGRKPPAGQGIDTAGFVDLRRRINDRSKDLVMYQAKLPKGIRLPPALEKERVRLVTEREKQIKEYQTALQDYESLRKKDPVKAAKRSTDVETAKGRVRVTEIKIQEKMKEAVKENPILAKPVGTLKE